MSIITRLPQGPRDECLSYLDLGDLANYGKLCRETGESALEFFKTVDLKKVHEFCREWLTLSRGGARTIFERYLPKPANDFPEFLRAMKSIEEQRWRLLPFNLAYEFDRINDDEPFQYVDKTAYAETPESFLQYVHDNYPKGKNYKQIYLRIPKSLPSIFYQIRVPQITHLSLTKNELVYLPQGAFNNFPNLEFLDLTNNKLRSLSQDFFLREDGSFANPRLHTLGLFNNPMDFTDLPKVPKNCKVITEERSDRKE